METRELFIQISGYIFSAVTGVVGWFASGLKRRNDALHEMQESIDMLSAKNAELIEEIIRLREENSGLKAEIAAMRAELEVMKNERE